MCQVVAPSLTPVQPARLAKTNRKEAGKLARLLRAGLLAEVHPPGEEQETLRDLCGRRDDVLQDLHRAEYERGEGARRGSITKAGTGHVRRLLVEAACYNLSRPAIGLPPKQ